MHGAQLVLGPNPACPAGAVEVRREASQLTGLDLPATLIFDYPSVAEIAEFIVSQLPAPIEQAPAAVPAPVAAGSKGSGRPARGSSRRRKLGAAVAPAAPAPLSAEERIEIASQKVRTSSYLH